MRFAYNGPDGHAVIVSAAPKEQLERSLGPMTDKQYRAHVIARNKPHSDAWVELPSDWEAPERTYRNAWILKDGKIEHDMEKARTIHREHLRKRRAPLLAALDVQYMRADEAGDSVKKTEIAGLKKALRDVTDNPGIDGAKTIDELKAAVPDVMK